MNIKDCVDPRYFKMHTSSVGLSTTVTGFLRFGVASSSESLEEESALANFSLASFNSLPMKGKISNRFKVIVSYFNSLSLITCLFIFFIVKCKISQRYIFVNSPVISLENIQVATAEQSTICILSNLSIITTIICWWFCHNSKTLCKIQIWASSDSAKA